MSVCQGCGEPIEQPVYQQGGGRQRKWCSERCRKAQYAGACEVCGVSTTGNFGPGKAPKRCRRHNEFHDIRHDRTEVRKGEIEYLWRSGLSVQEIAAHTGATSQAVRNLLHRMRLDGRDISYGYDRRPQSVAKREREAA